MGRKAKELVSNARLAQAYRPPDMRGRVTHSDVWTRALARWKPGTRVTVEFGAADGPSASGGEPQ